MLFCDVETRSEVDLSKVGAYKYASHPSTELLMVSYAFGDEEVKLWECHKGPIPTDLKEGLEDPFTIVVAWNGMGFERLIFKYLLGIEISSDRVEDPMFLSRYMSMPGKLEKVGRILDIKSKKLTEFFIKDESMVSMFCTPFRMGGETTLFGIEPTYYRHEDRFFKEWKAFCDYCKIDTTAMREIMGRLKNFPLTDFEYEVIALDAKINDRGIYTDSVLLQGAGIIVEKEQAELLKEFKEITGIANPKAPKQVLAFVRQHGYTFPSIGKPFVKRALNGECELDALGKRVLELRLQVSKSSVAKLESCKNSVMPDGRVRGLFNYMGAARTGRWTSGLFQAHNLIKATKEVEKKFDLAMELLKAGDYETIKKEFSSPLDVACSALRPILRAAPGKKFVIADLAAIESRGQFWVAGCESGMEEFRKGLDPYISFAVLMDPSKTYEELWAEFKAGNKKTRTDAKAPKLGCGFGLAAGDIDKDAEGNVIKTGLLAYAESMQIELTKEYSEKSVEVFRRSYKEVVDFWYDLHRAFANVVENDSVIELGPVRLQMEGRVLCIYLPSGRALHYINPYVERVEKVSKKGNTYQAVNLYCAGVHPETHQWVPNMETRGAKLFENIVQAICRDILAYGMIRAEDKGFPIVLSCHDEICAEVDEDSPLGVKELVECMTNEIPWAPGFILGAEGFENPYYCKEI